MMNPHDFFRHAADYRRNKLEILGETLLHDLGAPILPDTVRPITEANSLKPLYESAKHLHIKN